MIISTVSIELLLTNICHEERPGTQVTNEPVCVQQPLNKATSV